jgi:cold shock CspA family protein
MTGRVRIWSAERAFGWIEAEDGVSYFVHSQDCVDRQDLRRGERVRFTPTQAPRGPRACAVQILQPATGAPRPSA